MPAAARAALSATAVLLALALPGVAAARGGDYVFDGGSAKERTQVRRALEASAFDWDVVPARVTIHIAHGELSRALPGEIWLDADLLGAGVFSWATVQDEYAHQVDFFLLDDASRLRLMQRLGAKAWCHGEAALAHGDYGCERFASTLVWAYWPSRQNAYRPLSRTDESAAMNPAAFRSLLSQMLGVADEVVLEPTRRATKR